MSDDKHDKQGGTFVDSLARMTKIGGPGPSLDELFRGGNNNRFNISPAELDRQMKIHGGKL
jgi:hypothetical protein